VWLYTRVAVADGDGRPGGVSRDRLLAAVAASAHHALQFTFEGKAVPEKHRPAIRTLLEEYDPDQHAGLGGSLNNGRLPERVRIAEYLTERFAVVGSPAECQSQLESFADSGVDGVLLNPVGDTNAFLERFDPV